VFELPMIAAGPNVLPPGLLNRSDDVPAIHVYFIHTPA